MKQGLISIVMPCFRAEGHLAKMIGDIRNQTYSHWELIVVGNGTGQGPQREIVESFAARDARISYCSLPEAGVSLARNFGVGRAAGEWIAFVDADDRVPEDWLRHYMDHAGSDIDVVAGGIVYENETGGASRTSDLQISKDGISSAAPSDFVPTFLGNMAVAYSPCSKILRMEFLKRSGVRFDEELSVYEDGVFNLELLFRYNAVRFIRQTGYRYVSRPGSAIGRYHADLPLAVERRRKLLECVLLRAGGNSAVVAKAVASQLACDSLDILLNVFRVRSPFAFRGRYDLVRRLFADADVAASLRNQVPSLCNVPLVLFWLFSRLRFPAGCVCCFTVLFGLRRLLRRTGS